MNNHFGKLVAASAFAVSAGAASAATYNYDYTGSETNAGGPALSCEVSGILNSGCAVTYNDAGLGVNGVPDTAPGQIDGFPLYSGESLKLEFGTQKIWNSISFGHWDHNDDVELAWDGGSASWGPGESETFDLGGAQSSFLTVSASGAPCTSWFLCQSPDGLGNDNFTVASIDVSAVPLPAAGWMLLASIGGIAAMKRRKKTDA